jgi:acyl-CoA dehydrogenase
MEVIAKYGSEQQKRRWLDPLLEGKIRSAFLMTEPQVASSDATNIEMTITRDGDEYVLNGQVCADPRFSFWLSMSKLDGRQRGQRWRLGAVADNGIEMVVLWYW